MKGGKSSDKETSNCLKPYWLTIVVMNARRLSCRAPSIKAQSITRIFMRRLFTLSAVFQSPHIILYDWKMIFYKIFSNFLIHGWTEAISYMRMCVRVAVRGIPLYSRNTARRHVRVHVCVYTKLSNQGDFAWGWPLVPLGFGFYIFIYLMINKYITYQALVNRAKKILKQIWKSREIRLLRAV